MMRNRSMTPRTQQSREAYELLLKISRAANSHLELPAVLKATAECLGPRVQLDGIAVISVQGDHLRPHWLYSVKTDIEPGDCFQTVASRALHVPLRQIERRVPTSIPLHGSAAEHIAHLISPLVRMNLGSERRFPEEEFMFANGVRTVVEVPLVV